VERLVKSICFVNPTILLKRPIAELSIRLQEKGYKVGLLMPRPAFQALNKSMHYSNLAEKVDLYTYPIINPPFLSSEWPIPVTPGFSSKTLKILRKYDIIHSWTYFYITSLWPLCLKKFFPEKKTILTCDTFPGYSFDMPGVINCMMKWYGRKLGKSVFGMADAVTVYTQSLADMSDKLGIDKRKLKVIPTGIELEKFRGRGKDIKKELGIKKKEKMALFVGITIPRKGVDLLVETCREMQEEDVKFVVVGDGPNRHEYETLARNYKLDNIIFTGWRQDVKDFYKSADVFFFPSRGEGLPGVVMEAMACGLPCVASDIIGNKDLIEHGKTGFLCDTEDVGGYVDQLSKVLFDGKLRDNLGKNALEFISKRSWDNIVKKYEALYR